MKTNKRPNPGDVLTLSMDYWNGIKKGAAATVVSTRRRKQCASGLSITVTIEGLKHPVRLDARWFLEFDEKFTYLS